METLANLEAFTRSAELGGFSGAARRLGLTPAAVSRNVAMLERNLGVRLFHRSTRKLTLTEDGERFLAAIRDNLDGLQDAIAGISSERGSPAGVLKVSLSPTFGQEHILPLLPAFLALYPQIRIDWQFDNRQADLIAEGLDAAIGGGFELSPGIVSRVLAPAHIIAVASPAYMANRTFPIDPTGLAVLDGIIMRAQKTGRIRQWTMQNASGEEMAAAPKATIVLNDPAAMREAAVLGLGVTLITVGDALSHLAEGRLVRLAPKWYADAGPISIYYSNRTLLPAKTRAFVDFVAEHFRRQKLAERFAASLG
ncbi:LysR family transcriptional regulator [Ensifer sp.]|jgi:DNA-binding transcriptional LysR family regulator|uniref:LysR family transcriptional regulator n=1 Tax=Ensifer sp. TaxID=1872086 RepID=UPI002E0DA50B|nr:LysR substrate-binding domain-containing protein [Ensifer sp.]